MKQIDKNTWIPEAVVVGNGDFPVHKVSLAILDSTACVVCCDGAAHACLASGRAPYRIVGDGDSLKEPYRTLYADIVRYNPDQETNDQTKAILYLQAKGIRRVAIVGATGRREDHTLGNISLLMEYMRMGMEVRMYTDHGVFIPCKGVCEFACNPGMQVSVFSFGTVGLCGEGLVYPLRDFTDWWQGTLNETTGTHFTLSAEGEYLVFINYGD